MSWPPDARLLREQHDAAWPRLVTGAAGAEVYLTLECPLGSYPALLPQHGKRSYDHGAVRAQHLVPLSHL